MSSHRHVGRGSLWGRGLGLFLGAVLGVLALAAPASSGTYTFTDTTLFTATGTIEPGDLVGYGWGTIDKLDGGGDYVTWDHRFTFDPPAEDVLTGNLALSLRDDKDKGWFRCEFGLVLGEDGTVAFGEVDTTTYDFALDASYLADGIYRVTLASLGGDFFIDRSDLTVAYNAVPIPGSGVLLVSGLVGLLVWKRRARVLARSEDGRVRAGAALGPIVLG